MKNVGMWAFVAAFVAAGAVGLACGGGNKDAAPPNNGAPSATATEPAPSASAAPSASSAQAPTVPAIAVYAMKLTAPKLKDTIELKNDGTVMNGKNPVAKFVGAELQDKDGKTLVSVAADGTVTVSGAKKTGKFDDKDSLVIDNGASLSIADDGIVKLIDPGGKPNKDSGKIKLTGFKPTARRAGTLLVLAMFLQKPS